MAAPCSAVRSPEKTPKRTWPLARSWTSGAAGSASVGSESVGLESTCPPGGEQAMARRTGTDHAACARWVRVPTERTVGTSARPGNARWGVVRTHGGGRLLATAIERLAQDCIRRGSRPRGPFPGVPTPRSPRGSASAERPNAPGGCSADCETPDLSRGPPQLPIDAAVPGPGPAGHEVPSAAGSRSTEPGKRDVRTMARPLRAAERERKLLRPPPPCPRRRPHAPDLTHGHRRTVGMGTAVVSHWRTSPIRRIFPARCPRIRPQEPREGERPCRPRNC